MKKTKIILILSFLTLIFLQSNAQVFNNLRGIPYITNYSPLEYNAHELNFDIIQADDGIMYFANFSGILEFDGSQWNKIITSTGMRVLALDKNDKGTVFAAGLYDFGYLERNKRGITRFVTLTSLLESKKTIYEIFNVHCIKENTYFVSENQLYTLNGSKLDSIKFQNEILSSFAINNKLYIFFKLDEKFKDTKQYGLTFYENENFVQIINNSTTEIVDVKSVFNTPDGSGQIIGTSKQGFFLIQNNVILDFDVEINEYVKQYGFNNGYQVDENLYALGTLTAGVVLINSRGEIVQIINKKSNLKDETINTIFIDKLKSLWLATNNGLSKVDIDKNLMYYDNETSGLEGKVQNITKYENTLYFATSNGLYSLQTSIFNKISGINYACWDIEVFQNNLLLSTSKGIYSIENQKAIPIGINEFAFCITKSNINPNIIYSGHNNHIFVLELDKNKWKKTKEISNLKADVLKIYEMKNGDLYIETSDGKVKKYIAETDKIIELRRANFELNKEAFSFLKDHGVPAEVRNNLQVLENKQFILQIDFIKEVQGAIGEEQTGLYEELILEVARKSEISLHINKMGENIFFTSQAGIFSFDENTKLLQEYDLFQTDTTSNKLWLYNFYEFPDGNFLFSDGEKKNLSIFEKTDNGYIQNQTPYFPLANFSVQTIFYDKDTKRLYAGGTNGIIMFEYPKTSNYKPVFNTILRKITCLNTDSLIDLPENSTHQYKLKYSENSLRFDFTAPIYPAKGTVQYRYFLKGFDKDTSGWNLLPYKEYNNLSDAHYIFTVEARNEFGVLVSSSSFEFKVVTPLFRRWWAFIIYVVILIVLLKLVFDWRMRVSKKEKEALEETVRERTEEIFQSKKEIESQRDIAFNQRREILDSINYALRIQNAVLPSTEQAEIILENHFVIFKPCEIVSGDFYWLKQVEQDGILYKIVVAADCTGHGVPGAFMSMLGTSFLNEIIAHDDLADAGKILNKLRTKVKESLHQEGKDKEQKDGMDISFYILNTENNELRFAGAYNPLYIIRPKRNITDDELKSYKKNKSIKIHKPKLEEKGEAKLHTLIEIKASRQPIGIYIKEHDFANNIFQLKKGDTLYSFSDGYVDQFGGETNDKFKAKRFKNLLLDVQDKEMPEQKQILERTFAKWKGHLHQIDDIIIIGMRI